MYVVVNCFLLIESSLEKIYYFNKLKSIQRNWLKVEHVDNNCLYLMICICIVCLPPNETI